MIKNNIEKDIKIKCVEADTTQAALAEKIGKTVQYVNRIVKKDDGVVVVRHINLGSIRHFKLVENNIKQFTQHINLCFFCALF